MTPQTVILADDHPLFREGVARVLNESGRFTVLAEAASGREAVDLVRHHRPDLAVLDLSMPDGGLFALEAIMALEGPPKIAMLTVSEESEAVFSALEAGASGYILKGVGGRELVSALSDICAGESYVAPALAARVLTKLRSPRAHEAAQDADLLDSLTKREEEILRQVAAGLSNKEVARVFDLQEKTVKHHMTQILHKLQVRNRTEAALIAQKRGL